MKPEDITLADILRYLNYLDGLPDHVVTELKLFGDLSGEVVTNWSSDPVVDFAESVYETSFLTIMATFLKENA